MAPRSSPSVLHHHTGLGPLPVLRPAPFKTASSEYQAKLGSAAKAMPVSSARQSDASGAVGVALFEDSVRILVAEDNAINMKVCAAEAPCIKLGACASPILDCSSVLM